MTEQELLELKMKLPKLVWKKQWVCYQLVEAKEKDGSTKHNSDGTIKYNKIPKNPNTSGNAAADKPETWGTMYQAYTALNNCGYDGLGFELSHGVYFGIDIDHAIDRETGEVDPVALDIINTVDSYTEISPSGTGFHILCKGQPKLQRNKRILKPPLELEMYCPFLNEKGELKGGRFLTVTGNVYGEQKAIEERTEQGQAIHDKYLLPESDQEKDKPKAPEFRSQSVVTPRTQSNLSDYDIIQKAMNGKNGARFWTLWNGDISAYDNDHSSATQALVNDLCYWTNGDRSAIDRLFRQSALYSTMKIEDGVNKWDKVHSHGKTYGEATIDTALDGFVYYVSEEDSERIEKGWKEHKQSIVEAPPQEHIIFPEIISWNNKKEEPRELPPAIIEDILHEGHRMCMIGSSKAGKSQLLIELCVALSEGRKWLNCFQCMQSKVLYINLEIDPAFVYDRIDKIEKALKWNFHHRDNLLIWNFYKNSSIFQDLDMLFGEIISRIKALDISVLVIDPIYKLFWGDENNSEEVKKFLVHLDRISKETNCTIIYSHHHPKGSQEGKAIIDRASGSGVFARDIDTFVDVEKVNSNSLTDEQLCSLRGEKELLEFNTVPRNFKMIEKKDLWFDYPIHYVDESGEGKKIKEKMKELEKENKVKNRLDRLIYFVESETSFSGQAPSIDNAVEYFKSDRGFSKSSIKKLIKEYPNEIIEKNNLLFIPDDDNEWSPICEEVKDGSVQLPFDILANKDTPV